MGTPSTSRCGQWPAWRPGRTTSSLLAPAGPVEPRNVYGSFARVAESAGIRVIRLHDARHGTAALLTAAGVAPRVVTEILGHGQIGVTSEVDVKGPGP